MTTWIIIAGILLAAEMFTGTFYLLVLSLGAGAGALADYAGIMSVELQIAIAAVVSVVGYFAVRTFMPKKTTQKPSLNPSLNIDIGETVRIDGVNDDGTARVTYRGAVWRARVLDAATTPQLHTDYVIEGIDGATLILAPKV